jgi:hypothetical protein
MGRKRHGSADVQLVYSLKTFQRGCPILDVVSSRQGWEITVHSGIAGAGIVQYSCQSLIPGNDQWMPVLNSNGSYTCSPDFFALRSFHQGAVGGKNSTFATRPGLGWSAALPAT